MLGVISSKMFFLVSFQEDSTFLGKAWKLEGLVQALLAFQMVLPDPSSLESERLGPNPDPNTQ